MVQPAPNLPVTEFAEYVRQQRDTIGEMWMKWVRESPDIPQALLLSPEVLQDHVPQLIDLLIEHLRSGKEGAEAAALGQSRSHGTAQWKAGYDPSQLIWELYLIRRVLTEYALASFARDHPAFAGPDCAEAARLIHDFFHRVTCVSVGQMVEDQQKALQASHDALRQTSESRERLTRTIAHELRNVLNSLTLAIQLMKEGATEEERTEIGAICTRMLSDMARILNDLLDYSALMAGRSELTIERFQFSEVFDEIVSEWRPSAEQHGLTFDCECDPALDEVVSDRLKIKQIAGNLLSNAIKYRKPKAHGHVGISFTASGKTSFKMLVVDTGIGIAKEDMQSLFGEFSRIRATSAVTGTGLGLAICKEFAELLGGYVEVQSEEDEGSRFEVTLPLKATQPTHIGDTAPRA